MKKLLALVLALVMTMSLAVTSNAADFADNADVDYNEATDVLAAVGVLAGGDGNKVNPKATFTRAQAAKLAAYMDLGGKAADALSKNVTLFSDLAAGNWAAGYVAYCVEAGYLAGNGAGGVEPDKGITAVQYAKMMLCALGYNAKTEGYVGDAWANNIATDAIDNDLFDGLDVAMDEVLTREEGFQMTFNALKADTVKYSSGDVHVDLGAAGSVTVGGSAAEPVTSQAGYATTFGPAAVNGYATVQLLEKLYKGDLLLNDTSKDDLNRPSNQWSYKTENIGTYAAAADKTLVSADNYGNVLALYKDKVNEDYDKSGSVADVYVNGNDADTFGSVAVKKGDVVEYYIDNNGLITDAIVTRYDVAKITKVDTKLTKEQKEDGNTAKLNFKVMATNYLTANQTVSNILDTDLPGFDAETYVKDAYVLIAAKSDRSEIYASELAKSVEGKVTATKAAKVEINGTWYSVVAGAGTYDVGDAGEFFLNKAGQIVADEAESTSSDDYAYIYNVTKETSKPNADGITSDIYTAWYVKADGTKGSNVIKMNGAQFDGYAVNALGFTGAVAYEVNSDNEFVYKTANDTITAQANMGGADADKDSAKLGSVYGTNDTQYVFTWTSGTKQKVETATGYKNVKIAAAQSVYTVSDDGEALYVFVPVANGVATSDTAYAVLLDANYVVTEDADGDDYFTYDVSVNGEDTTLTFETLQGALSTKGIVFTYEMDGAYAVNVSVKATLNKAYVVDNAETNDVDASTSGYIIVNSTQYNMTDETEVYVVTFEFDDAADYTAWIVDTVTVTEGSDVDKDDVVYVYADDGDAEIVFVVETVY